MNPISIDSLKIRIPLRRVEVTNPTLLGNVVVQEIDQETGEFLDSKFKQRAVKFGEAEGCIGYEIKALIYKEQTLKGHDDFLTLLVSSKALESQYLSGISASTLPTLLAKLNSLDIGAISMEHLLEAKVSDIDFKRDWVALKEEMISELKHWEPDFKPSQKKGVFIEHRKPKKSHILQVNDRHSSSHIGRPFFKVYNKQMELEHNSPDFAKAHLSPDDYKNLYRFEFTVKNKRAFKQNYDLNIFTLQDALNLTQEELQQIELASVSKNFTFHDRELVMSNELPVNIRICIGLIEKFRPDGYSFLDIYDSITAHLDGNTKRRWWTNFEKACAILADDKPDIVSKEEAESISELLEFRSHYRRL